VPAASKKHSGELLEHLSNVQEVEESQSADRQIDVLIRPEQMPKITFKGSPPGTLTRTTASILDGWSVCRSTLFGEAAASGQARCTETAGLRAFSPRFPLTQRHAVYLRNLKADLRPIRRDWVGRSSLQVAGSRSSSRKHPATGRPHRTGADVRHAANEDANSGAR
jgi:hypothetical protein